MVCNVVARMPAGLLELEREVSPQRRPPGPPKPPSVGVASPGAPAPAPGPLVGSIAWIYQELRKACSGYQHAHPRGLHSVKYRYQIKRLRQQLREAEAAIRL